MAVITGNVCEKQMIAEDDEDPSFSDPEDFVDDVTDEELLPAELLAQRPVLEPPQAVDARCLVVDHVPLVGPEKLGRLRKMICELFTDSKESRRYKVVSDFHPLTEAGATKGYAFLEYASADEARQAAADLNGNRIDRRHTLAVHTLADFERYMAESESADWKPTEAEAAPRPYQDPGNLQHWLLDTDRCDQFSVVYEDSQKTDVFCCSLDGLGSAAVGGGGAAAGGGTERVVKGQDNWTVSYVRWSPRGTYLATFHKQGVGLFAGEGLEKVGKFHHPDASLADFSPCERYLVTYPPLSVSAKKVHVWDIRSGVLKRSFQAGDGAGPAAPWPTLRWSHDGSYVARMGLDELSIYEAASMRLLDAKSMKLPGIRDFQWSPTDNVLAYWTASVDQSQPSRVTLVQIPSRQELASRHTFNMTDCRLLWQRSGDYLCAKVDKKPIITFYIFCMREKEVTSNVLEMRDSVLAFALEPCGSRLAVLHGDGSGGGRGGYSASIYLIKSEGRGKDTALLRTFPNQQANALFWSPRGQFLVLAGLQDGTSNSMNGQLTFVDAVDCIVMNDERCEHYACSEVEWDPTGRYVATSVSWWHNKVDTAYWLWSFQGRMLQKNGPERFCQMRWRPRPPSLLSGEEVARIHKELPQYAREFEKKDRQSQSAASEEQMRQRQVKVERYQRYRQRVERDHRQMIQRVLAVEETVEETVEVLIHEERIPL